MFLDDFFEESQKSIEKMFSKIEADIIDGDDTTTIRLALPGYAKEDIKIFVEDNLLTIAAGKKLDCVDDTFESIKENKTYVKQEIHAGYRSRTFDISKYDSSTIKATYKNGILEVTGTKKPELKRKEIAIVVE